MSEVNPTSDYLDRIHKLSGEAAGYRRKARDFRSRVAELEAENEQLKGQLDSFVAEHDEAMSGAEARLAELETSAATAPDEWKTKHDTLQGQLHQRDHRDAWREAIGPDALADGYSVEKLWRDTDYKAEGETPSAEALKDLVGKARAAAPYGFRPAADAATTPPGGATKPTPKAPLQGAAGGGRGDRDTTALSRLRVSKADLRNPERARQIQPEIAGAMKDGREIDWTD